MRNLVVKNCVLVFAAALLVHSADAQRTGRSGRTRTANSGDTTKQQVVNNTQPSGYNPYGNIPIRVDTSGVINETTKKSLRTDNAFDKKMNQFQNKRNTTEADILKTIENKVEEKGIEG